MERTYRPQRFADNTAHTPHEHSFLTQGIEAVVRIQARISHFANVFTFVKRSHRGFFTLLRGEMDAFLKECFHLEQGF
jgi:hypothetical protein